MSTKPNQYTAKQFIEAIPGTGGIIGTIAQRVGCKWHTAKKYIDEMPTVRAVYDDECEIMLDVAESAVVMSVKGGDTRDAKWYLQMKGKQRGYVDRQEVTGAEGKPISIIEAVKPESAECGE